MNIVLIGYRGTGKSTVAGQMSERLGWPKISTDDLICRHASQSIPQIVNELGWKGFRDIESLIVKGASKRDRYIIDTGGGVILREENLKALHENGVLIWLMASVETIQKRIHDCSERPALTEDKSMIEEIREVLEYRTPIYRKTSDHQIDTDYKSIDKICEDLIGWLLKNGYVGEKDNNL